MNDLEIIGDIVLHNFDLRNVCINWTQYIATYNAESINDKQRLYEVLKKYPIMFRQTNTPLYEMGSTFTDPNQEGQI